MTPSEQETGKILIALDGSRCSRAAARSAVKMAAGLRFSIEGLCVVDVLELMGRKTDRPPDLAQIAPSAIPGEHLRHLRASAEEECSWLKVHCAAESVLATTSVEAGGVPEVIARMSDTADVIALGRRGNGHEESPGHLGANFRVIAHHSRKALLVGGEKREFPGRLLVAYDGSERGRNALSWAARLQKAFSCPVDVVPVYEESTETASGPESHVAEIDRVGVTGYRLIHRTGAPADGILTASQETGADMIVLGGYRHGVFLEWLLGSTVDRVLRTTDLPVLIA